MTQDIMTDGLKNIVVEDITFEVVGMFINLDSHGLPLARACSVEAAWVRCDRVSSVIGTEDNELNVYIDGDEIPVIVGPFEAPCSHALAKALVKNIAVLSVRLDPFLSTLTD